MPGRLAGAARAGWRTLGLTVSSSPTIAAGSAAALPPNKPPRRAGQRRQPVAPRRRRKHSSLPPHGDLPQRRHRAPRRRAQRPSANADPRVVMNRPTPPGHRDLVDGAIAKLSGTAPAPPRCRWCCPGGRVPAVAPSSSAATTRARRCPPPPSRRPRSLRRVRSPARLLPRLRHPRPAGLDTAEGAGRSPCR